MGHLTRIANHIAQSCEKGPNQSVTSEIIKAFPEEERERWEKFVSGDLSEANQRNTVDLESTHNMHCSTDDEEGEIRDFSFPQEAVLQQAFADYQIQQMTSNFIDHFGFNDEQFGEQEDGVNAPFDKASNINFSLNVDNESLNSSLFDLCCKEKIQQFDDDDDEEEDEGENSDEEDVWQGEEPRLSVGAVTGRCRSSGSTDSRRSRDSEEEERENEEGAQQTSVTPDPKTKEADFGWVADFSSLSISPAQSAVDPGSSMWERSGQPKGGDGESWVNFSNSSKEVSMETSPAPQTAVTSQQSSKQTTDVLVAAPPSSLSPPASVEAKRTPSQTESNCPTAPPAVKEGKCTSDVESNSSSAPPAVKEGKCPADIESNSSSAPPAVKEGKCSPAKPESNTEKVVKLNPGNVEACTAPPTATEGIGSPETNRETQSGSPAGEEDDSDSDKAGRSGGSSGANRSPKKMKNLPTAPPASTEGKCSSGPGRAPPGVEREREEGAGLAAALPNGERERGSSQSFPSMQRCSSDAGSSAATSDSPSVTQTVQDRPPADITEKATPTGEKPPSHSDSGFNTALKSQENSKKK